MEVSRKRVQRLMRATGLSGLVVRKRGRTTIRVPGVRIADDLVERRFRPDRLDVLWVADITYLRTWEGWIYLAAVQDAYSRRIVVRPRLRAISPDTPPARISRCTRLRETTTPSPSLSSAVTRREP